MSFKEIIADMSDEAKVFSLVFMLMFTTLIAGMVADATTNYCKTQVLLEAVKHGYDLNQTVQLLKGN